MKPTIVILNPAAGHGNGARALPMIEQTLTKYGIIFDLVRTEHPGHGIDLTRQAIDSGAEVIISAGGDGTMNEVINGLMQAKQEGKRQPVIGVLSVGRGNDFSGSLGLPADLDQACQVLAKGDRRWIDIGRLAGGVCPQGRYFGNFVGVGFDAIVTIEVAKLPRWGGFVGFMVAVLKTIFLYNHAPLATIEFGNQTITQRSLLISIMNGRRLGGGFYMAPNSQFDDGLLDLCIAEQMSSFQVIRMIPHFLHGTQATQKTIKTGQAAKIVITAHDGPLITQTDGEIISKEGKHLEIELLPHQIEIICQPTRDKA